MEVEHVKAHCTEKDKKEMSHLEKFITYGNGKADELAKAGAMLDEGFMAEARANTAQQERERERRSTVWYRKAKIVKSSSRSQKKQGGNKASNGMMCCSQQVPMKGQQVHEHARKMCRAEILVKGFGKMRKAKCGRTRYGKKNGQTGRSFALAQIMLGLCEREWDQN